MTESRSIAGKCWSISTLFLLVGTMLHSVSADTCADAREAMRRAGSYWSGTVASHGGYVWEYSTDLVTRRRGESGDLPTSVVWVQSGTPMVGEAFLNAYETTCEQIYLDAAIAAGRCLAYGQLESGGWAYSIDHDPSQHKYHYHHVVPKEGQSLNNTTTFDDNTTQSATRFLIHLDLHTAIPEIDAAIERALHCFLAAQYNEGAWDGAWPQRYPPPTKGYGSLPTFNDGTMSDCVGTMLAAYDAYGEPAYLESTKRCLDFYLRSQLPAPQSTWAQQYDRELRPAWARRFEPPAVTGGESCGNCKLLLSMYERFSDKRYLDAVARCVKWYEDSRIGGEPGRGIWARFYELGTNTPLYFTRTYELTYDDSDLPRHYSFQSNYGVDSMIARYRKLAEQSPQEATAQKREKDWTREEKRLRKDVVKAVDELDPLGRWLVNVPRREQVVDEKGRVGYTVDKDNPLDMMYSRTFVSKLRLLASYIRACQEGNKAPCPEKDMD